MDGSRGHVRQIRHRKRW